MILITGGLGFLGVTLSRYLAEYGKEVLLTRRRTSRLPAFLADYLGKEIKIADCDLLDFPNLMTILKKYSVESIIHAATVTQVNASLYQGFKTNLEGTINVLEAARIADIKRISFTSSVTVYYGMRSAHPYQETMPLSWDGKHFISSMKIAAEALASLYAEQYGLEVLTSRISVIYGPHNNSGFIPLELMVEKAVNEKRAVLPKIHPEDRRDFVYVDDCARALALLHLTKEPKHRVYNIAFGSSHTYNEVAEIIKKILPDSHIELTGEKPPWSPVGIDIGRLYDELGYKPEYDLEKGIQKYIEWIVRGKKDE